MHAHVFVTVDNQYVKMYVCGYYTLWLYELMDKHSYNLAAVIHMEMHFRSTLQVNTNVFFIM